MQDRSTEVSLEKVRLFQDMEAELTRYHEEYRQRRKRGQPLPPEPQFDQNLYLEMRAWQARRLSRKVQEEVMPLIERRYQQRETE